MEQTITCPGCNYTFRIAKETFEKYKTGVSLKKHEMTDGDAILLDCAGCGRVLKISITTWNVVGEGPAQHMRGYEWVGGERPRLAGAEEKNSAETEPTPIERVGQTATRIHLTEYGRVEKPLPEGGLGALLGLVLLSFLPIAAMLGEPVVMAFADDPGYVVPVPPKKRPVVEQPAPAPQAAPVIQEKPAEPDEPRLLTPVKEPSFRIGGDVQKLLKDHNQQLQDIEKRPVPAK